MWLKELSMVQISAVYGANVNHWRFLSDSVPVIWSPIAPFSYRYNQLQSLCLFHCIMLVYLFLLGTEYFCSNLTSYLYVEVLTPNMIVVGGGEEAHKSGSLINEINTFNTKRHKARHNGSYLLSQHFGRSRWADHLSSGIWDQPEQHGKTPSLQKIQKN